MIKNINNLEEYKKYFRHYCGKNQYTYDLDKIINEMFEIRKELFRLRCR